MTTTDAPPVETRTPEAAEPSYLEGGHSYRSVTDKISSIILTGPTQPGWLVLFALSSGLLLLFVVAVTWLLVRGVGIWGIDIPVAWGFAITNFV
jgi:hypothetical protein